MRAVVLLWMLGACGRVGFDDGPRDVGTGGPGDVLAASYPGRVLADHPRAYYRLGEQPGSFAIDATVSGTDGD